MEKIQIPKLQGKSNFTVWKLQVTSILQYHDFEGILTDDLKEPESLDMGASQEQQKEHETAPNKYNKANGFAVTLLTTTVEEEPL